MATVSIQEAEAKLSDLIHQLQPGEEPHKAPRRPGTLRGSVLYMAPDFDAPLEEFKDYME